MKNKTFLLPIIFFILVDVSIYYLSPNISFYNSEFLHPLFWFLIPLTILYFLASFLNNIKIRHFSITIFLFSVASFIILSQVDTTCSPIVCIDRNFAALMLSSTFSIIYFIIQFFKNRKQSTLLN